ncbi:MAG: hypothetical protein VKI81_12335 [Synechococcaceae cyanobacterium]|nr:hypothetical protein [Synechococcaceae cyanobacterium]
MAEEPKSSHFGAGYENSEARQHAPEPHFEGGADRWIQETGEKMTKAELEELLQKLPTDLRLLLEELIKKMEKK